MITAVKMPGVALVAALAFLASSIPEGCAQQARPIRPLAKWAEAQRARQIISLYLRQGVKQPHVGEQTTRLLRGRVRESQQVVKCAGPGRLRIEYLSPPALRGEILLTNGGRLFNYRPAENKIWVGPAPLEEFQSRARALMQSVKERRISVQVVGTQIVAGQSAAIIEIRAVGGGAFFKRFWIDERTGVRLKNEELDPQGNVISTSYFTRIDYAPSFSPAEFHPTSLPSAPYAPLLPPTPPLPSVQAAQDQVAYTIRQPSLPAGFRFSGAWVVPGQGGRQTTILRYTDGVNVFTLFQIPARPRVAGARLRPGGKLRGDARLRNGVAHWMSGDQTFTLLGNLKPENAQQVIESLR